MSDSGGGRPIVQALLCTALGAALTAAFTQRTQSGLQKENLELQQQLEEKKSELQKQLEAAKEDMEMRRDENQHVSRLQEIAVQHLYQHRQNVIEQERQSAGHYWTVSVKNSCSGQVFVALHYRALDGEWTTRGWWTIPKGETVRTAAETASRTVYYFANNSGAFAGVESPVSSNTISRETSVESFEHLDSEPFTAKVTQEHPFRFYSVANADWTDPVIEVCPTIDPLALAH